MSISRTGECPIFLDYITKHALVPIAREASEEFLDLTRYNFSWVDVPSFCSIRRNFFKLQSADFASIFRHNISSTKK